MSSSGYSQLDYLKFTNIDDAEEYFNALSKLSDEDMLEYKALLKNLEKVNTSKVNRTKML
ncbi:hypothetical protein [Paenibacillus sonchi]|uniref:hypothetical protein n=1 Tax=Paenibacillus sonchi TaxID=373687 RepID=UPI001E52C028|nr:hypothetical protein [Paenibacillus sonchi]